jgi:1-acyl-sn-glycerol-3-phosphate acyltransferase
MDSTKQKPLTGWRKTVRDNLFPKVARVFLFGFGFNWIRVKGSLRPQEEAPIVVIAPHTSALDMFVLGCFAIPTVVSNTQPAHLPFVGRAIRTFQPIFVSREDKDSRLKALNEMKRRSQSKGVWSHIVVFPEATTTNGKCVIHFKSGAFQPGLPVLPMLVKYSENTMKWSVDGLHPLLGFFLTICRPHNGLEVEFLPVHKPTHEEKNNPVLFARNTKQAVGEALGVSSTLHTYEDMILAKLAKHYGLPLAAILVEFASLPVTIRNNFEWSLDMFKLFVEINVSKTGFVVQEEMETALKLDPKLLQQLFQAFARNEVEMRFRDFLLLCDQVVVKEPTLATSQNPSHCKSVSNAMECIREAILNKINHKVTKTTCNHAMLCN